MDGADGSIRILNGPLAIGSLADDCQCHGSYILWCFVLRLGVRRKTPFDMEPLMGSTAAGPFGHGQIMH